MMLINTINYFFHTLFSLPRTVYGMYCMSRIYRPFVTVFGGKRVKPDDPVYAQAYDVGVRLARKKIGVITGGGSGVMEAALCGAVDTAGKSGGLGIGVVGVDEGFIATCKPVVVQVSNFEIRKRLLSYYSDAFIIFEGGVGTLDEFAEVINLIKLAKIKPVPIVLIGAQYWHHIIQWFEHAIQKDLFLPEFKRHIMVTDDIDSALSFIRSYKK